MILKVFHRIYFASVIFPLKKNACLSITQDRNGETRAERAVDYPFHRNGCGLHVSMFKKWLWITREMSVDCDTDTCMAVDYLDLPHHIHSPW